jgi:hypothetical protein
MRGIARSWARNLATVPIGQAFALSTSILRLHTSGPDKNAIGRTSMIGNQFNKPINKVRLPVTAWAGNRKVGILRAPDEEPDFEGDARAAN